MTDNLISSPLIKKLGHNLFEIRERALLTLISKLNKGFVFDNDLARSKEILSKLFDWFLYEPCSREEIVFTLLKRILTSKSGHAVINHYGANAILKELKQIRDCVEAKYHHYVKELVEVVEKEREDVVVPPLVSDKPLSYRSGESDYEPVDSTATSLRGHIVKEGSVDQQKCAESEYSVVEASSFSRADSVYEHLPNFFFDWQPLITADENVLESVEKSLRDPPQPSALLHSCKFFTDVLLHDFPAEVFLQRPQILTLFQDILATTNSTRVGGAVLNCLIELTRALKVRTNHCKDVAMHSLKKYLTGDSDSVSSQSESEDGVTSKNHRGYAGGDNVLRKHEIPTTKYCFMTLKNILKYLFVKPESFRDEYRKKRHRVGVNNALYLLDEVLLLLGECFKKEIWNQKQNEIISRVLRDFNEVLVKFGDILEYYRFEVVSQEENVDYRVVQLCLLHKCREMLTNFLPLSKINIFVPKTLKVALSNSLMDVPLCQLFPNLHASLLEFVEIFSLQNTATPLQTFRKIKSVCRAMTAAHQFSKNYQQMNITESTLLFNKSLPALEFHMDLNMIKFFVEICATKLPLYGTVESHAAVEDAMLKLLSHHSEEIRVETYKRCHRKVVGAVGPKLNLTGTGTPTSQVLFLLKDKLLTEMCMFGIKSDNEQIRKYADDILLHILKSKLLITEEVWKCVKESIVPTLPILLCFSSKGTALGRTLIEFVEPDIAKQHDLEDIEIIKGNVVLLFNEEEVIRSEAFSRLCWLLSSQPSSRDYLPRLNTLLEKNLSDICLLQRKIEVNKIRCSDHFYQPSSVHQVFDLLDSPGMEPVIKRSALTQLSVMMEDHLLHDIFVSRNGTELILKLIGCALNEEDYNTYPDSVVPAISVLKSVCYYNRDVREDLSRNIDVYYFILRGLFLFWTEERMKEDCSILLFLLIYSDFVRGSPSKADMALPALVPATLKVPFSCDTYLKTSQYTGENLAVPLKTDRWSLSCIQTHWNAELFGGYNELIKMENVSYENLECNDLLKLSDYDLRCLKWSSVEYALDTCLNDIQNGTSHTVVVEAVHKLNTYTYLYGISLDNSFNILSLRWEVTLAKFLRVLPSSKEDVLLLHELITFLEKLVAFYKICDTSCWIIDTFKDQNQTVLSILTMDDDDDEDNKLLTKDLLNIIAECAMQEQHFFDFYVKESPKRKPCSWSGIVELVAECLKFGDSQHFYNLALLDSLLKCLVNLSAMLGWSQGKLQASNRPLKQIVVGLCELVHAFHSGKGSSASVSVMGLSITRNSLLILNHILAELKNSNIKRWDVPFMETISEKNLLKNFLGLWLSRDVVTRAAVMQLFAGLTTSSRAALDLVNEYKDGGQCLWKVLFGILFDHEEASVVRENAALTLANLSTFTIETLDNSTIIQPNFNPEGATKNVASNTLMGILKSYDFFKNAEIILKCLYTNVLYPINEEMLTKEQREIMRPPLESMYSFRSNATSSERSWSSSGDEVCETYNITTPAFVAAFTTMLFNMEYVGSDLFVTQLHDTGIVKLLFRCLCNPAISVSNNKELALYCDLIEMNTVICCFLNKLVRMSNACMGTVLHTKDCLNVLLSLLNPKIYDTNLSQLIYLRNKLWAEIFYLLSALVEYSEGRGNAPEALNMLIDALDESGRRPFFESLCESVGALGCYDLQTSSLTLLTCLLRVEILSFVSGKSNSLRNLLDKTVSSRSFAIDNIDENLENIEPEFSTTNAQKQKMNLLENLYFGKLKKKGEIEVSQSVELMIGAELFKILMQLYEISNFERSGDAFALKKATIISAMTGMVCVSKEAKRFALNNGLFKIAIKNVKELHIRLSLESVDFIRRVADRKRVSPVLKELNGIVGLLTNFMMDDSDVKEEGANYELANLFHKLWNWFGVYRNYLVDALRLLATFTTKCTPACQSLPLTSSIPGAGLRKVPGNDSILHAILNLVAKEMDFISKTHDLGLLRMAFHILKNSCSVIECRICIAKSNLLQWMQRLNPVITKRQKPWEHVEYVWFDFLKIFTLYPEGQALITKTPDILELVMLLTSSTRVSNRECAMNVLQNIAFYPPNRPKLLNSSDFVGILQSKLDGGTAKEKSATIVIMWALAANNQKAKIAFKSANLHVKIQETMKKCQVFIDHNMKEEDMQRMEYVLNILNEN